MRLTAAVLAAMAVLALACCPAVAQNKPAEAPKPAAEPPVAPFEPQLLRLSEIMGALAFLRELCDGQADGEEWRKQMSALLQAEAPTSARKARFAGAYNKGFRGFERTYRACTPNAREVIELYLAEGSRIARDVANKYGGG